MPKAHQGVLDLRSWQLEQDGPVKLAGEWHFFWKQLHEETPDPDESTGLIRLPGIWNEYQTPAGNLGSKGYATYHLKVLLNNTIEKRDKVGPGISPTVILDTSVQENETGSCRDLAFKIQFQQSAYRLFVNQQLISEVGKVSSSEATGRAEYRPHVASFVTCDDTLDIVIQVSNYHHRKGGLESPILFGTAYQVIDRWEYREMFDLFLLGAILIMGFYHLALYVLRRQNRSPLYFGLFCLMIAIRSITVGQYFILELLPGIPWRLLIMVEYLSFFLPLPLIALFIHSLFPKDFPRLLLWSIIAISGALTLTLLTPPIIFTHISTPFQVFLIIAGLAMTICVVRAFMAKREGAWPFLIGLMILFATMLNDILYNQRILPTSMLFPFGLFIFIFIQSFVLSLRFSKAFSDVEVLSDELEARNRRLLELDRLKDEFITNTSHELRTPLTGIIGIAESLLDGAAGKISSELQQNLILIVNSGKRLANLVNDILDFSRLKHADIALSPKPVNLRSITDLVLNFSRILVSSKEITFHNNIDDRVPLVHADEDRVQQILTNLIGNAIKFTTVGQVTIDARKNTDLVEISVSDTGIGIPREKLSVIFESFEQADGSISREFGGSGLGLAVTKNLVELHGGRIWVNSEEDRGSVFTFTLPIASDQARFDETESGVSIEEVPQPVAKVKDLPVEDIMERSVDVDQSATILIVDDEPVNIQVLSNQLSMHNFGIITAMDGYQALKKLEQETPDLVLLDLMMPGLSGYDTCVKIRETHNTSELPIIILTAKNQVGDLVRGLACGANDYITKPFAREELLSRIDNQLKLQRYSQELLTMNLNLEIVNQSLEKRVAERTRELSARNEQIKEFLHILCHDLLNPFSSLSSIMEVLQLSPGQFEEMQHYMRTAIDNGIAMIEMVRKMKDLEESKLKNDITACTLTHLIDESHKIMSQQLQQKQLSLNVTVDPSLKVMVEKTSFINSVLSNVLSNAIKFSYSGSAIEIFANNDDDHVYLYIRDYGIGMPPSISGNLFAMDKSTSRKGTNGEIGTGYGMPLVKRFIKAYGGSIEITSTESSDLPQGRGTRVCLILKRP